MIDSGSACSLITKALDNKILEITSSARWITTTLDKDLKTFSNELIKAQGQIETKVIYNGWICEDACLTVVEDRNKLIIG